MCIFKDPDFPLLNKTIQVNDFVVNKNDIEDIKMNSVGVVTYIGNDICKTLFIGKNKEISINITDIIPIDIHKTGKPKDKTLKPFKYKICNICHILKNQNEDFEYNQNDKYGRQTTRPSCKDCRKDINGKPLPIKETQRMNKIKPKEYQLFECPTCKKRSIPGVTSNIVIDHNHIDGNARAWICDSCNTGLGRFKDNQDVLKRAINYLNSFSK